MKKRYAFAVISTLTLYNTTLHIPAHVIVILATRQSLWFRLMSHFTDKVKFSFFFLSLPYIIYSFVCFPLQINLHEAADSEFEEEEFVPGIYKCVSMEIKAVRCVVCKQRMSCVVC